jgi:ribosomal protein S18 acetylase RimI-like enzyme
MPAFRPAVAADIPALHALIESAYRGESAKAGWTHEADLLGGQRTDVAALAEIVADPAQTLIVAEDGGVPIGCVRVADKGGGTGYLGMLTVRPALQAAGTGRALLGEAERHARTSGARVMEMTVIASRTELVAWYLRRGYADTGRRAPFPLDDPRFGLPKTRDLEFVVLAKALG